MAIAHVGTSGFSYKEWRPLFYPEKLPEKQFLRYYSSQFNAVEIDSTFYRMPVAKTIDAWRDTVPESFRFTLKAPQKITHREKLGGPPDATDYFLSMAERMGDRLGHLLFQLPPFLRADSARLQAFIARIAGRAPLCFEFRHASWFTEETYDILRHHQVALCFQDTDEGCTPLELTGPSVYVRLRRSGYSEEELAAWSDRIRGWTASGRDVFVFIKHQDNPRAPLIARDFARRLEGESASEAAPPPLQ